MADLLQRKCAVKGCASTGADGKTKLFALPQGNSSAQKRRRRVWMDFAGLTMEKKVYFCYRHFEEKCFRDKEKRYLMYGAVPSKNTGVPSVVSTDILSLHCQPNTSTPKSLKPLCLFPPDSSASSCSESNADTLAMPLDSSVSLSGSAIADVTTDITSPITSRARGKHRSLVLSKISVSRTSELTPRKKFLHGHLKTKLAALAKLKMKYRKKTLALKELATGLKGNRHQIVGFLSKSMSLTAANLLASQVGRSQRTSKGHRWSVPDKLLALSLYKRSPKCYTLLRSLFALPCKSTLINLLNRVPFGTGINSQIFEALTKAVSHLAPPDRVCSLMFDGMAIREHIHYDPRSDRILGYEDLGKSDGYTDRVANHAQVFMAKGLRRKWKQPVGFYFSKGDMSGRVLSEILKEVLKACREAGLVVVNTVCDMAKNNVNALQELGASFGEPFFTFENQEVVTLYDPPHLLKCTRNMLYKHDVLLKVQNGSGEPCVMTASWSHIRQTIMLDRRHVYQALYKITEEHLDPGPFKKMKVSLAAQIMSNTMAVSLHNMCQSGDASIPEAATTAKLVSTLNQVFDSTNGTTPKLQGPGGLKSQLHVKREALHLNFWDEIIDEIDSWQFLKKSSGEALLHGVGPRVFRPPSQDGWLATMRGMKHLWSNLKQKGFRYIQTRSLNQDSLEHLFGCIRSNCGSNYNPTVGQFQAALKTAIVNGLVFKNPRGTNCEEEFEPGEVLSNLHEFLLAAPESPNDQQPSAVVLGDPTAHSLPFVEEGISYSVAYVAGYIAKRLLKDSTCNNCRTCITTDVEATYHAQISLKEHFANKCLSYPTESLCKAVGAGATLLEEMMPQVAFLPGVWKRIAEAIKETVDFLWIREKCVDHEVPMINGIVHGICAISIPWWCRKFNKSLKNSRNTRKLKIFSHQ